MSFQNSPLTKQLSIFENTFILVADYLKAPVRPLIKVVKYEKLLDLIIRCIGSDCILLFPHRRFPLPA